MGSFIGAASAAAGLGMARLAAMVVPARRHRGVRQAAASRQPDPPWAIIDEMQNVRRNVGAAVQWYDLCAVFAVPPVRRE
jgi:hypothetical protein